MFERAPLAEPATFHRDDPITDADIEKLVAMIRARVLCVATRRGALPDDEFDPSPLAQLAAAAVQGKLALGPQAGAPTPCIGCRRQAITPVPRLRLCAECDGFSLHANICIPRGAIDRLEQLARYAARPPIVEDRLSLSADGCHAIYRFRRPFRDGSTNVVLSWRDFTARLAALIPRPRAHLVTCHSGDPPEHARVGACETRRRPLTFLTDPRTVARVRSPLGLPAELPPLSPPPPPPEAAGLWTE